MIEPDHHDLRHSSVHRLRRQLALEEARDLRVESGDVGRLLEDVAFAREEVRFRDEAGDSRARRDDTTSATDIPDLVPLALAHVERARVFGDGDLRAGGVEVGGRRRPGQAYGAASPARAESRAASASAIAASRSTTRARCSASVTKMNAPKSGSVAPLVQGLVASSALRHGPAPPSSSPRTTKPSRPLRPSGSRGRTQSLARRSSTLPSNRRCLGDAIVRPMSAEGTPAR